MNRRFALAFSVFALGFAGCWLEGDPEPELTEPSLSPRADPVEPVVPADPVASPPGERTEGGGG